MKVVEFGSLEMSKSTLAGPAGSLVGAAALRRDQSDLYLFINYYYFSCKSWGDTLLTEQCPDLTKLVLSQFWALPNPQKIGRSSQDQTPLEFFFCIFSLCFWVSVPAPTQNQPRDCCSWLHHSRKKPNLGCFLWLFDWHFKTGRVFEHKHPQKNLFTLECFFPV